MHPYYVLRSRFVAVAEQLEWRLRDEDLHPDDFGSCVVVFERGHHKVRLVWDGKDGVGFVEHRAAEHGPWTQVGPLLGEGQIEHVQADDAAISDWEADVRESLGHVVAAT